VSRAPSPQGLTFAAASNRHVRGGGGLETRERSPGKLARVGPLHRDDREVGARHDRDVGGPATREHAEPGDVLVRGAGVHDQAVCVAGQEVRDEVVDHPAPFVQQAGVEGAPGRIELRDVVRERVAEEVARTGTEDLDHAHVRHVEHARGAPHGMVLLDLGAVVERHLPACEVDEFRPRLPVDRVQHGRVGHTPSGKRKGRSDGAASPSLSSVPERLRRTGLRLPLRWSRTRRSGAGRSPEWPACDGVQPERFTGVCAFGGAVPATLAGPAHSPIAAIGRLPLD
jgi:hypothetical protein